MTDKTDKSQEDEEVTKYEKLASRTRELFEQAREKSASGLDSALDHAKDELVAAGEFSAKQGERLRKYVRRDLNATSEDVQKLLEKIQKGTHPSRVGAGFLGLVHHVSESLGSAFDKLATKTEEKLTYHTGEISGPGTLICTKCSKAHHLYHTGRVPPCSGCKRTEFRKSY